MLPTTHSSFFFFRTTATSEIYTLSLHDALPISLGIQIHKASRSGRSHRAARVHATHQRKQDLSAGDQRSERASQRVSGDRKSTRLNSSHTVISYAVFCLKKKKKMIINIIGYRQE